LILAQSMFQLIISLFCQMAWKTHDSKRVDHDAGWLATCQSDGQCARWSGLSGLCVVVQCPMSKLSSSARSRFEHGVVVKDAPALRIKSITSHMGSERMTDIYAQDAPLMLREIYSLLEKFSVGYHCLMQRICNK